MGHCFLPRGCPSCCSCCPSLSCPSCCSRCSSCCSRCSSCCSCCPRCSSCAHPVAHAVHAAPVAVAHAVHAPVAHTPVSAAVAPVNYGANKPVNGYGHGQVSYQSVSKPLQGEHRS